MQEITGYMYHNLGNWKQNISPRFTSCQLFEAWHFIYHVTVAFPLHFTFSSHEQ